MKERSGGEKLPSMKSLKAEKEKLTILKDSQYNIFQNLRGYQNELKTVCANVDMILGKVPSRQQTEKEKNQDIS